MHWNGMREYVRGKQSSSYYYMHMIQESISERFLVRFKCQRFKKMNAEDEKYRIKPRKKYRRQVWLKDGKAIIVEVKTGRKWYKFIGLLPIQTIYNL
jgi:hypothetical protein